MKKLISFACIVFFLNQLTAQRPHYDVYAIRFASMRNATPTAIWAEKAPEKDSVHIDFMIWLIKGSNGKNILLDAGFLNDLEDAKDFDVVNYIRPDSVLSELSLNATDITDIILSHPHWDHIDGVSLFPKAQIWMQKDDYNYCIGAAWQKNGDHGGFNKRDMQMLVDLNLAGRLNLVDGDNKEIADGVKVYTGSRHTYNSEYAVVETGTKKIVLASDNIWVYYSLDHMTPAPPIGTLDSAGYVKAMARMKTLATSSKYIIPGHDSKVFTIFPLVTKDAAKIE